MLKKVISVIVPVYNVEKYLRVCLDSIAEQTYKHLEVILVEDCSTDSSAYICDEYAKRYPMFKVLHKQVNEGAAAARNAALEIAKGEYITFIDSDDWIERDMYRILVNMLERYNVDIIQCGNYNAFKKCVKFNKSTIKIEKLTSQKMIATAVAKEKISPAVWGKLYRRHVFDDLRFMTNIRDCEDLKLMISIFSKPNISAVLINRPMYFYRILQSSKSRKEKSTERCLIILDAHKEIDEWVSENCPIAGYMEKYKRIAASISVIVGVNNKNGINNCFIKMILDEAQKMYNINKYYFNIQQRVILYIALYMAQYNFFKKAMRIYVLYFNYSYNINLFDIKRKSYKDLTFQ